MVAMRKTCYFAIGIILLFSGFAQAGNIIVEPTEYNIDLIGGDTITRPITITWAGETAVVGFIETTITPDDDGINVTYSESPVILLPNTPKIIVMAINTMINLAPDKYTIETVVLTEIEKVVEYRGGGGRTIYETVENLTQINILLDIIEDISDELNLTKEKLSGAGDVNEALIGLIDDMLLLVQNLKTSLERETDEGEEDEDLANIWVLFVLCCSALFIAMLYIIFLLSKLSKIKKEKKASDEQKVHNFVDKHK